MDTKLFGLPSAFFLEFDSVKDGWIRGTLKRIALLRYTLDLQVTRWIKKYQGEPYYRLGGNCALCARCCESPMIQGNFFLLHFKILKKIWLGWHRKVNGFEGLREDQKLRAFVFRCTHFDPITRRCDSYSTRPGMCRDYPQALLYSTNPPFFPECGYYAIGKNAEKFSSALERLALEPEKLEALKSKLHLTDKGE
jgi:Fe-S-cluster containining protein